MTPIWTNFRGDIDDDINFEYEPNTEVYQSCAATLDGEMWVLGGYYKRRQVKIDSSDYRLYLNSCEDVSERQPLCRNLPKSDATVN